MKLALFLFLNALAAGQDSEGEDLDIVTEAPIPVTEVEVVLGLAARLPCDLTPPTEHDRVSLIIWYKDGAKTPIYSLDVRERGLGRGKEVKKAEARLSYTADSTDSALILEAVNQADRGLYKCRVDFKHSPTRNAHVNLSIVVPPSSVLLTDASGVSLPHSTLGPIAEGSLLEVACVAFGGWPTPRVTWWQDNDMVDGSLDTPVEGRVSNTLTINTVTRELLESKLECRVSTSPLLDPIVVLLYLDIMLVPLDVRLVGDNLPLSADSLYEVACRSVGSKPEPSITWWRAGKLLQAPTRVVTSEDRNVTTSTVSLTVRREDNGQSLSCRAANPQIPDSVLEHAWTLDIHYRPVAAVVVGSSLNASNLKEGGDVYLECRVDANPRPSKVLWTQNGVSLTSNASYGVLLSNQTLVLQGVRRESSGAYSCTVSNTEGENTSEPYTLDIKYQPVCKDSQQRVYGAGRLEEVLISCEVDANPPATEFSWTFNNSVIQERPLEASTAGSLSRARYTAFSETDYGTVLCWAANELGLQQVPCVFHVVPAGVPDVPYNCSVAERSQVWVHISCVPGFDGGLPQFFTAEVWHNEGNVVSNTTSRSAPSFTLTSLEPGVNYKVVIYSSNIKGRSERVATILTATLGHTQSHRRTTEVSLPTLEPLQLVVSGIVIGVLLMVGIVLVAAVCIKRRALQGSPDISSLHLDKTHSLLSVTVTSTPAIVEDDRNPDVVPHTTEVEATTLVVEGSEEVTLPPWVPANNLPKEGLVSESWGVSVWPGQTALHKLPVHRNAGTQTLQHKESTV